MVIVLSFTYIHAQTAPKVLFYVENTVQRTILNDYALQRVYVIYKGAFVVGDGITFSKKRMKDYLNLVLPDKTASGYAVLDWEGYAYNIISGATIVTDDIFQNALNSFIAAVNYAKYLRPNYKWSIYGMPTWLFYTYSLEKPLSHSRRIRLFESLDFLAPSCYMFDRINQTIAQKFAAQYIDNNIKYCLELGVKLNKPVYPFVWQRYQPYLEGYGYQNANMLIPRKDWIEYISRIVKTKIPTKNVDGVIWWHSMDFLYSIRTSSAILTEEFKNVTNVYTYQDTLFRNYYEAIKPVLVY